MRRFRAEDAQREADASQATTVAAAASTWRHPPEGAPEGGAFEDSRRHNAASLEPGADWQGTSPVTPFSGGVTLPLPYFSHQCCA